MLLLSDAEFNLSHAPPSGPGNTGFLGGQLPPGAPSTKAASYDIKVMNLLPWWQVYDWADHERAEKMEALKAIKRNVVQNPRMDAANIRLQEDLPLPHFVNLVQASAIHAQTS